MQSWKYIAPMWEYHVNHTWHDLLFLYIYIYLHCSHVYQPIAMQLCRSPSHDTLRVVLEAGREEEEEEEEEEGWILSVPSLMRLMSHHLSVWELPEKKPSVQGTQRITHDLIGPTVQERGEPGFSQNFPLFPSRMTPFLSVSFYLIALILLSFCLAHTRCLM